MGRAYPGHYPQRGEKGVRGGERGELDAPSFEHPLGGCSWLSFCLIDQKAALKPTSKGPSSRCCGDRPVFLAPPTSRTRVFDDTT